VTRVTAGPLAQALEVARADLRAEARGGETLPVIVPFGAVALLLLPLAAGADVPLLRRAGWGMFWVVVLLFGTLVTVRSAAAEGPAQRDLLALLGVEPGARFAGRAAASGLLLAVFQALLLPVAVVLFDPELSGWPWLALLVPLVAAGLGTLGTLAGLLTDGLGARATLAPLLAAPLAVPVLLAGAQIMAGTAAGRSPAAWIALLITVDMGLAAAGLLAADALDGASR